MRFEGYRYNLGTGKGKGQRASHGEQEIIVDLFGDVLCVNNMGYIEEMTRG